MAAGRFVILFFFVSIYTKSIPVLFCSVDRVSFYVICLDDDSVFAADLGNIHGTSAGYS